MHGYPVFLDPIQLPLSWARAASTSGRVPASPASAAPCFGPFVPTVWRHGALARRFLEAGSILVRESHCGRAQARRRIAWETMPARAGVEGGCARVSVWFLERKNESEEKVETMENLQRMPTGVMA